MRQRKIYLNENGAWIIRSVLSPNILHHSIPIEFQALFTHSKLPLMVTLTCNSLKIGTVFRRVRSPYVCSVNTVHLYVCDFQGKEEEEYRAEFLLN